MVHYYMITPTNHVIAPGPLLHFENFHNIFLPIIGEDQKSLTIWAQAPGTEPCRKFGPGYCITFIKRLDKGLRKQLLGLKPLISPGLNI